VNQADLQRLSGERIKDAEALLAGGRWEFAYYSAGYAVECAMKSAILARMVLTGWVFQEKWDARKCLTHDMDELITLAGLRDELDDRVRVSGTTGDPFLSFWGVVKGWKVTSRYESKTEAEAKDLYTAIAQNPDGVLLWIQKFW
jgi:hypothetical protein